MKKINILVLEDEVMIAEDLTFRLEDMGYNVVAVCNSYNEAIEKIDSESFDLALLDIHLNEEKTGVDVAQYLEAHKDVPFVFLSSLANQKVLSDVKKLSPSGYMLKPFVDRQLQISLDLALSNYSSRDVKGEASIQEQEEANQDVASKKESPVLKMRDSLFLRKGNHYEKIEHKDILYLEADNNYTIIQTTRGRFTYSLTLKVFESRLPQEQFLRVHRSFIVNKECITGFEGNMIRIGEKQIPINKASHKRIFDEFDII